jgi:uncharacterized membrane protein YjgN (DUF898 family)
MSVPEVIGSGTAEPPEQPPESRAHALEFSGRLGEIFVIFIVNLLLDIVTLTFYRFWGRTRVRRYLWSQGRLLDEPFEYIGNGLELFVGFLIVLILVILPLSLAYVMLEFLVIGNNPELEPLMGFVFYPFVLFLVGVAIYRARGYRLSRTFWRGIRMAQTGSAAAYGGYYMIFFILSATTLGWLVPEKNIRLWSHVINNSYLGSERFRFDRVTHGLYKPFAVAWLLAIPTLGLSFAWYKAAELRFLAGETRFQNLSFSFDVSGGRLLGFTVLNALISIFTLGLGAPFVQLRTARLIAEHLRIEGEPELAAIGRSIWAAPGMGEGLAEAFDMGAV